MAGDIPRYAQPTQASRARENNTPTHIPVGQSLSAPDIFDQKHFTTGFGADRNVGAKAASKQENNNTGLRKPVVQNQVAMFPAASRHVGKSSQTPPVASNQVDELEALRNENAMLRQKLRESSSTAAEDNGELTIMLEDIQAHLYDKNRHIDEMITDLDDKNLTIDGLKTDLGKKSVRIADLEREKQEFCDRLQMTNDRKDEILVLYNAQLKEIAEMKAILDEAVKFTQGSTKDRCAEVASVESSHFHEDDVKAVVACHEEEKSNLNAQIEQLQDQLTLAYETAAKTEAAPPKAAQTKQEITPVLSLKDDHVQRSLVVQQHIATYLATMQALRTWNTAACCVLFVVFLCACVLSYLLPDNVVTIWLFFLIIKVFEEAYMQRQINSKEVSLHEFRRDISPIASHYNQIEAAFSGTRNHILFNTQFRKRKAFVIRWVLLCLFCCHLWHIVWTDERQQQMQQNMQWLCAQFIAWTSEMQQQMHVIKEWLLAQWAWLISPGEPTTGSTEDYTCPSGRCKAQNLLRDIDRFWAESAGDWGS